MQMGHLQALSQAQQPTSTGNIEKFQLVTPQKLVENQILTVSFNILLLPISF